MQIEKLERVFQPVRALRRSVGARGDKPNSEPLRDADETHEAGHDESHVPAVLARDVRRNHRGQHPSQVPIRIHDRRRGPAIFPADIQSGDPGGRFAKANGRVREKKQSDHGGRLFSPGGNEQQAGAGQHRGNHRRGRRDG